MKKKEIYKNRYGDIYTFTLQEDDNILWEGDFKWCRYSDNMIDPSGGPCISIGMSLKSFGFKKLTVFGFLRIDNGYLIITKDSNT